MKLPLKEPLSAKYLYLSKSNTVHVFMPVVSGTSIGLDNTCKAVFSLQEFFGKGSNSNQKATLKRELLAYKEALEYDISLLNKEELLSKQKQERLTQIHAYVKVITELEKHQELDCLDKNFPSYPRPLEELMQNRKASNLYSMVLRPTKEDGYLRTEAANPIFSAAHQSVARNIGEATSPLQEALMKEYKRLTFKTQNLKSQVISKTLVRLESLNLPVDFKKLRAALEEAVKELLDVSVDFSKDKKGKALEQKDIDERMFFDSDTKHQEYIEALLGICCDPNVFENALTSPLSTLTTAEQWSLATQFLLGITNIYSVSKDIVSDDTNFGKILDSKPKLCENLAQMLTEAQKSEASIEKTLLHWMNEHSKELNLKTTFTEKDAKVIAERFATLYAQVKDANHFDEFFILDSQKKGHFFIHQGAITTSFALFATSKLFELKEEWIEPLQKACKEVSTLTTEIPHKNQIEHAEVDIDTKNLDNNELQALYEQINTYQDQKIKKHLLTEFKKECPDFKPKIDAKKFLQHVAYGEQNEAEDLLNKDNTLAQELLTAKDVSFTDYSGRTFKCTAYEYAYWAKDTHMCRMLERCMDDNTKNELLNRVEQIEELTGEELFKKPRGLVYTQNGKECRSPHFDLTPLKQALKTYIDAYDKSPKKTQEDWDALGKLWIQVGLPQREVPAHIAHEYCHPERSFEDVSKYPSLLDASKPEKLKRSLKFYNFETSAYDSWFTRDSYSVDSGLGFSFAILHGEVEFAVGLRAGGAARAAGWARLDLLAIEAIDKVRTEDLKRSLKNLATPSIQQTQHIHDN